LPKLLIANCNTIGERRELRVGLGAFDADPRRLRTVVEFADALAHDLRRCAVEPAVGTRQAVEQYALGVIRDY
jgi:hypothetical protein